MAIYTIEPALERRDVNMLLLLLFLIPGFPLPHPDKSGLGQGLLHFVRNDSMSGSGLNATGITCMDKRRLLNKIGAVHQEILVNACSIAQRLISAV